MIPIAKDIQKQDIRQLNAARYPHLSSTVFDICALVTGRQIPPSPGFLLQNLQLSDRPKIGVQLDAFRWHSRGLAQGKDAKALSEAL